jgi:plastocyanin
LRLPSLVGGAVVASALLFTACDGTGMGSHSSSGKLDSSIAQHGTSIAISNFMFTPMSFSVEPGARIMVTNRDSVTHTLTATDGTFNTGDIAPMRTKTIHAPMRPGAYHYICNIHQYMTGTITVK